MKNFQRIQLYLYGFGEVAFDWIMNNYLIKMKLNLGDDPLNSIYIIKLYISLIMTCYLIPSC